MGRTESLQGMEMATQHCSSCGAATADGQRFCSTCGHELQIPTRVPLAAPPLTASQGPISVAPTPSGAASSMSLSQPEFWADVRQRAQRQIFPLVGVAVFGFLDFQLHDQILGMLIVLAAGAAITLFAREFITWATTKVMSRTNLQESSLSWVQPLFFS